MPAALEITFVRKPRHWQVEVKIDGDVEPRTIFGCNEGTSPLVGRLMAAEAEVYTIGALSKRPPGSSPPSITMRMPSGRLLTFDLTSVEQGHPEVPEGLSGAVPPR
jgi:hypothetical protein